MLKVVSLETIALLRIISQFLLKTSNQFQPPINALLHQLEMLTWSILNQLEMVYHLHQVLT